MIDELTLRRRFFAEEVQTVANLKTPRLVDAFARVPRERFLRPGPWLIRSEGDFFGGNTPRATPDADPRHVLHNVVVAIDPTRQLFNGQPSALGTWIDALALQPGDRVLHVGCGLGYYTALIAACVGESGRVLAFDVDPALAAEARSNLVDYPQVEVRAGNGIDLADADAAATADANEAAAFDAIMINAGMSHPHENWLAALRPGGRMALPLTVPFPPMGTTIGKGIVLLIQDRECERRESADGPAEAREPSKSSESAQAREPSGPLDARLVAFVAIYSAVGIRDDASTEALGKAMARNPFPPIKRLRRDAHEPSASCWMHGDRFCISLE